ncbi:MAG: hypothetical protein ACK50Q_18800 [Labrys sp. (in: a-proteobacteria)]|jgi:hypothetical protein
MQSFFDSGRIIDVILLIVALEVIAVLAFRHRISRRFDLTGFFINLASGVCLMLALRAAMTDAPWVSIAPFLLASFLAHLVDIVLRRRRSVDR